MKERQFSWAGGELAPGLWGRTDISRYSAGARTLKNFLVSPHATLLNRSGTQHVVDLGSDQVCLVPFVVSPTESYVLVFVADDVWIQVWRESPTDNRHWFVKYASIMMFDPGNPTALFPYTAAQLVSLRWAQHGLYLTLCTEDRSTYEVRYASPTKWSIEILDTTAEPFPTAEWTDDSLTVEQKKAREPRLRFRTVSAKTARVDGDPPTYPAREWIWALTYVVRSAKDGKLYETQAYEIERYHVSKDPADGSGSDEAPYEIGDVLEDYALYPHLPMTVWTGRLPGAVLLSGDTLYSARLYRGRSGHFGFIGETTSRLIDDDGAEPIYSDPPPQGSNPIGAERPCVPFFYESRRGLAATSQRPATVWGSSIDMFDNFDEVVPADDSDSYEFTIASKTREAIRWAADLGRLVLGSLGGIWVAGGSGLAEVLTPNSIAVRRLSNIQCADLRHVEAGDAVFFAELHTGGPRMLENQGDALRVSDISLLARHLFDGYAVADWAYAESPHQILWVVRSDGLLLSFTYVPELEILAWARHEPAGGGLVENVCCKPEGAGESGVWLCVRRGDHHFLERLAYRGFPLDNQGDPDVRYCIFLDRCVTYNGLRSLYPMTPTFSVVTPADYAMGATLSIHISHVPILVAGEIVRIDDRAGGEPYFFSVVSDDGGLNYTVQLLNRALATADCPDGETEWWVCRSSVSGLPPDLNGSTVTVVADGDVYENVPVTAGSATIDPDNEGTYLKTAGMLHAGLPYNSDFESLDVQQKDGKQKIVKRVAVELEFARGGAVGADLDHLVEIRTRAVEHGYGVIPLRTTEEVEPVADEWGRGGRVAIRQSAPMPMTILGILREYTLGGD
jgi:hypothetical protein